MWVGLPILPGPRPSACPAGAQGVVSPRVSACVVVAAHGTMREPLQGWKLNNTWKYHLKEGNLGGDTIEIEALFSIPTRRRPVPNAYAGVTFLVADRVRLASFQCQCRGPATREAGEPPHREASAHPRWRFPLTHRVMTYRCATDCTHSRSCSPRPTLWVTSGSTTSWRQSDSSWKSSPCRCRIADGRPAAWRRGVLLNCHSSPIRRLP